VKTWLTGRVVRDEYDALYRRAARLDRRAHRLAMHLFAQPSAAGEVRLVALRGAIARLHSRLGFLD
jgi:hypothetical protein